MKRSSITQRGLVLLLVVSTFCPALYAGFKPEQHVIVQSETNGPTSVYAADLDGDGDLDVLSASCGDSKIAWYANDGTAHFGPQQVISTDANEASCVYAADLDADGDLDVLSASSGDDKIAWYANDGTGQFGSQQVITTEAARASCVYAADLDGDGDLDVLSASWDDGKIAWYANDGMGQFGPQQAITTQADGACSIYAADLDGDGDLDVLLASYGIWTGSDYASKIAWYSNDGTGQFGPQQVITTEVDWATYVYASDLDGDGDLDVLSASYGIWTGSDYASKIAWYSNDGTGQFGPQQVITTEADYATCVYAADLDGDGDLDVLSASASEDKIAWYGNDGSGRFGPQQVITAPSASGASHVYAADLDGDGDLDALSASFDDGKVAWYANDGKGQFGPQQVITTEADGANCVYAADLDGDGDLDVLSASWGSYDFDLLNYVDSKIAWYANDGMGQFGLQQVITTGADYARSVYAADLEGDGDLDVLSASFSGIAWYANDGTGQFGPTQAVSTYVWNMTSVYAADLDGDGDLDVLSASPGWWSHKAGPFSGSGPQIAWYANDGTGQFGLPHVITTEVDAANCVYAADLDGDGDLDVLSASEYDDKIAWYANDGTGQLGPQQVITTEAKGANCVYAADLDGDGDLDILSASHGVWTGSSYTDSKIAWYANDGTGQFGPQQVISTEADGAECVYAADLDGDGDLDILSASWDDNKIAWYENE